MKRMLGLMLAGVLLYVLLPGADGAGGAAPVRRYIAQISLELPSDWIPVADLTRDEWGAFTTASGSTPTDISMVRFGASVILRDQSESNYVEEVFGQMRHEFEGEECTRSGPEAVTHGGQLLNHYAFKVYIQKELKGEMVTMDVESAIYIRQVPNKDGTRWLLAFLGMNPPESYAGAVQHAMQSIRWDDPLFKYVRKIGRRGEGPGEYQDLKFFGVTSGGPLYLYNDVPYAYGAGDDEDQILVYGRDGNYIRHWKAQGQDGCDYSGGQGVAVDASGQVFIAHGNGISFYSSEGACRGQLEFAPIITVVNNQAGDVFAIGENRIIKLAFDGSKAAEWPSPEDAFSLLAPNGELVALKNDARVHRYDAAGQFLGAWDACGAGVSNDTPLLAGAFDWEPKWLDTDPHGNIYVLDRDNNCVRLFDPKGNFIAQIGNHIASDDFKMDLEPWCFYMPSMLKVDGAGSLFVVDSTGLMNDGGVWYFAPQPAFLDNYCAGGEKIDAAAPVSESAAPAVPEQVTAIPTDLRKLEAEFWVLAGKARGGKATPDEIQAGLKLAEQLLQAKPDDPAIGKGLGILQNAADQ